jgi:hypothetical protein
MSDGHKRVAAVALIALLALANGGCERAKTRLDREVDRLCAIDGGIKVYEAVVLPPDKFNALGQPLVPIGKDEKRWGYHTTFCVTNLNHASSPPTLERETQRVVRTNDQKVIAESVVYRRLGGELFDGYLHGSGYHCPAGEGGAFLAQVFKNER